MGNTAEISLYCRKCFYDLRGIGTPSRCPECGGPFDLSNPKTFRTRRPRGIWRRLRWVIYPLLLIALASAGGIGWLWLGWHREQPAINWVRSRLSSPVKTEVLGPLWLQRKLGRWGDRLERVYAIDAVWLNPGTSAKECPLWRLSRLREITLMGSGVHDEWTSLLATQQRLEVVRLPLGSVTNDGVAALVRLRNLRELDLSGNPIADPALEHLAKLSNLQILSLMHTGVRGSGLAPLSHMPKLEVVLLAGTPLDDSAVEHLARLPNLKRLDLRGTTITPEGLAKLKQALPNCQILPP